MRKRKRSIGRTATWRLLAVAVMLCGASSLTVGAPTSRLRIVDLGTLQGGYTVGVGINDLGVVVGVSVLTTPQVCHAFLWQNGVMQDLGASTPQNTEAHGVNDAGQVAGFRVPVGSNWYDDHQAVLWQNGLMQQLCTLGGAASEACAINNSGQVVGFAYTSANSYWARQAVIWANGTITPLGTQSNVPPDQHAACSAANLSVRGSTTGVSRCG